MTMTAFANRMKTRMSACADMMSSCACSAATILDAMVMASIFVVLVRLSALVLVVRISLISLVVLVVGIRMDNKRRRIVPQPAV